MRDKVMNEQLNILEVKKIAPTVSFDGLRKVDNLPRDLRKTNGNDDLYLPPLFNDKKYIPDTKPGIQYTSEESKGPNNAPRNNRKVPFEPLASIKQKYIHSGNKLSEYINVRNRYYSGNPSSRDPNRYNGDNKRSVIDNNRLYMNAKSYSRPEIRYQPPSSAYIPKRSTSALRKNPSGNLPKLGNLNYGYGNTYKSPYVRRSDNTSNDNRSSQVYAPITNDDYTIEALQQKKIALQRLNERIKEL